MRDSMPSNARLCVRAVLRALWKQLTGVATLGVMSEFQRWIQSQHDSPRQFSFANARLALGVTPAASALRRVHPQQAGPAGQLDRGGIPRTQHSSSGHARTTVAVPPGCDTWPSREVRWRSNCPRQPRAPRPPATPPPLTAQPPPGSSTTTPLHCVGGQHAARAWCDVARQCHTRCHCRTAGGAAWAALRRGAMAEPAIDEDWEEWDRAKDAFWVHAAAGSAAGVMEHTLIFPVDTFKVRRGCAAQRACHFSAGARARRSLRTRHVIHTGARVYARAAEWL